MDKAAAADAFFLIQILKAKKWEEGRIKAAMEAILESYRIVAEAEAQRVKH